MTIPPVVLIMNQGTSQLNSDEVKEAIKTITQRKTEHLTNKSSKIKT